MSENLSQVNSLTGRLALALTQKHCHLKITSKHYNLSPQDALRWINVCLLMVWYHSSSLRLLCVRNVGPFFFKTLLLFQNQSHLLSQVFPLCAATGFIHNWHVQMAVTSFDSSFSPELFNKALLILSLTELSPILHQGALLASSVPFLNAHIEFFPLLFSASSLDRW